MNDQKNTILFVVLSALILIGWQIFFGVPYLDKQKQTPPPPGSTVPGPVEPAKPLTRDEALALSPRVKIETPRVTGSIALKGGRIDDLSLTQYRETVDPASPAIVLLSPAQGPHPFYADFGWLPATGTTVKRPDE